MRLPGWLFNLMAPLVDEERRIRTRELHERADQEERDMRAYYDRLRAAHRDGTCGGAENGCCYVPCVPRVS